MRLVRLTKPTVDQFEKLRATLDVEPLNYQPGILGGQVPDDMVRDTTEIHLGAGDGTWSSAKAALRGWAHFDLGWVGIATGGLPPQPGLDVIVHASLYGVQLTTACRVLSTHEVQDRSGERFGFTYGSLQSHLESGEETFEILRDNDGRISYRIDVMARPARWYTAVAKPLVEYQRRRFRRDSAAAMKRYVTQ